MSNIDDGKRSTLSIRIGPEMYFSFNKACEILGLDKSDFLKTCVEKLVDSNRIFLDNMDKVQPALDYLRVELSKLPSNLVLVDNGTFEQIKDVALYILCDELFRTSEKVWLSWKELVDSYALELEISKGENMFEVEDLGMFALPSEKSVDAIDIIQHVFSDLWTNQLELKNIILLLSTVDAFKKFSATEVVKEALEYEASTCTKKLPSDKHIIVIDARGKIKRKGETLIIPAGIEHIDEQANVSS